MNYNYRQKGGNPGYPMEAEVWSYNSLPFPEWLTDQAKITGLTQGGTPIIETRPTSTGGLEILATGGNKLITLSGEDSVILYSKTHPLISLTPHQLELLYEPNIRK